MHTLFILFANLFFCVICGDGIKLDLSSLKSSSDQPKGAELKHAFLPDFDIDNFDLDEILNTKLDSAQISSFKKYNNGMKMIQIFLPRGKCLSQITTVVKSLGETQLGSRVIDVIPNVCENLSLQCVVDIKGNVEKKAGSRLEGNVSVFKSKYEVKKGHILDATPLLYDYFCDGIRFIRNGE